MPRSERSPIVPDKIYSASLRPLGLGHAMWYPEPHRSGEPHIGDVGFFKDGAFVRLFNVDVAAPEKKVTFWDRPFEISQPPPPGAFKVDDRGRLLVPGHYRSYGVRSKRYHDTLSVPGVSAEVVTEYMCSEPQGAVLVLNSEAHAQTLFENIELEDYISQNYQSWCTYVRDVLRLSVKPGEIFMVKGWIKTTADWALVALSNTNASSSVSLTGNSWASAGIPPANTTVDSAAGSTTHRVGKLYPVINPETRLSQARNQTIFIEQYLFQRRGDIVRTDSSPTIDEVYFSSLETFGLGHAIWYPEPHESGEPQVGDVGFMKGGAFIRLFNLDTTADNKRVTFWDPPFEISDPPPPGCFKIDHRPPLAPAHYRSSGVQKKYHPSSSAEPPVLFEIGAEYTCTEPQGAVLVLNSNAHVQSIFPSTILEEYIVRHHDSWCTYVRDVLRLRVKPSAIVVVRGWVKTGSDWVATTFSNTGSSFSASARLSASVPMGIGLSINDSGLEDRPAMYRHGGQYSVWTSNIATPQVADQTVFIQQYKVHPHAGIVRTNHKVAIHDIYSDSMESLGLGYAMWQPEPHQSGEPQIGDVGFLKEGAFIRLFNLDISVPEKKVTFWDPPFAVSDPLGPLFLKTDHHPTLAPTHYCSRGVQRQRHHASAGIPAVSSSGIDAAYMCNEPQGGVLVLNSEAHAQSLFESIELEQYITNHHDSWCAYATDVLHLAVKPSEIFMVSGWVKTGDDWALAALRTPDSSGATVSIGGHSASMEFGFGVEHTACVTDSVMSRYGPRYTAEGSQATAPRTRNQTVFIQRYKVQRRGSIIKTVAGALPRVGSLDLDYRFLSDFYRLVDQRISEFSISKSSSQPSDHKQLPDHIVYALSLGTSLGHALYRPEPHKSGEVQIGDVGFVHDGAFVRLLNLDVSEPDKAVSCFKPPFTIADAPPPEVFRDRSSSRRLPGTYTGKEINEDGTPSKAILELPDGANGEMLSGSDLLEQYIIKNHDSWYAYAREQLNPTLKQEQLAVVKGFFKTSDNARAFIARPQPARIETWGRYWGETDWCIFVSYYAVGMRKGKVNKIKVVGGLQSELEYSPTLHLSEMPGHDPLKQASEYIESSGASVKGKGKAREHT